MLIKKMNQDINIAIVGLDNSHSVEFTRRIQSPDCKPQMRVNGLKIVSCLRFETPFQNKEGLDKRQQQLENWGVKVTENFDDCMADCDAIIMSINDPVPHLDYFKKCAVQGKPVFIDKPLADTLANGLAIRELAKQQNIAAVSCSSLRYTPALLDACEKVPNPQQAMVFGPLGDAAAGSSIVWYGVHAFEMLQRAMGSGAQTVTTVQDAGGVVAIVAYPDGRRGTVELTRDAFQYGGALRGNGQAAAFVKDDADLYTGQLNEIKTFFQTGQAPSCTLDDAVEVMAMLQACQKSSDSGKPEIVQV